MTSAALLLALGMSGCATGEAPSGAADSPASPSSAPPDKSGPDCTEPPKTPGAGKSYDKAPSAATAKGKTFTATIKTNCGDIVLELDGKKAPQTVASFVKLADDDYWKNSPCHRLTGGSSLSVLQCGDPTGEGNGDPGYGYGIENAPEDGSYPKGTVAMARTQDPNSNGGQFFLVYADSQLPTDGGGYSIFAKVVGGSDVLQSIATAGVEGGGGDGPPQQPISILSVNVTEKKA
ncbi:peptidylprolyl isomerase [Demetria terragena]|uniref:peptidylprolyl isomerase n=1 Tax=Demetria terragena TaxID=63959 RepID=UPI000364CE87|nr:peptidylprolyl isomerase [Demetria terragena]